MGNFFFECYKSVKYEIYENVRIGCRVCCFVGKYLVGC